MKNNNTYKITLHLTDIEHFFEKPNISPFSPHYQSYSYTSGIEYVANDLRTRAFPKTLEVAIFLPSCNFEPDMEQKTQDAVLRYCNSRIMDIEQQMQGLRRRALQTLPIALAVLIVFIGLGTQLTNSQFFIAQLLGDGLGIIGWVYVWFPFDAIIFGIQQYRQDKNIYQRLIALRLTIQSAE
jgi:hypothetical protein